MNGASTAMRKRTATIIAPVTERLLRLNLFQKRPFMVCISIFYYLALILGSAIMYPMSASRFPKSVSKAPIVKMPMTVG